MRILGLDLSMNHAGAVILENETIPDLRFLTTNAEATTAFPHISTRMIVPEYEDEYSGVLARLEIIRAWVRKTVEDLGPDRAILEDYALNAVHGAHQMGEIGGQGKLSLWHAEVPFRKIVPTSLKAFIAHHGRADKDMMAQAVQDRWGVNFSQYDHPNGRPTPIAPSISEDLVDAYSLARIGWYEVQLRNGLIRLTDLHPKEIALFQKAKKGLTILEQELISKATRVTKPIKQTKRNKVKK